MSMLLRVLIGTAIVAAVVRVPVVRRFLDENFPFLRGVTRAIAPTPVERTIDDAASALRQGVNDLDRELTRP